MESPKVSVIVPIYNVERYIERCVRSLLEQTLDGIEFIFASKDGQSVNLYLSDDALEDILAEKYTEEELETIIINLLTSYME